MQLSMTFANDLQGDMFLDGRRADYRLSPVAPDLAGIELPEAHATGRSDRIVSNLEHSARLLQAFGGNTAGWEWTGEMFEQDPFALGAQPCACGHQGLRYLFPWKHPDHSRTVITGSSCVETVPGLSGASIEGILLAVDKRVKELARAKREAAAKVRRAAESEEVVRLREECLARFEDHGYRAELLLKSQGYYVENWNRYKSAVRFRECLNEAARMKSAKGQANRYKQILACWK